MNTFFDQVLNMGISATWLVLVVIVLRFGVKKVSKRMTCMLWILVAVRLCCPVLIESDLSLIPSARPVNVNTSAQNSYFAEANESDNNSSENSLMKNTDENNNVESVSSHGSTDPTNKTKKRRIIQIK